MSSAGDPLNLLKKLFVIRVVIDRINLRCVNDKHWTVIVGVEETRISIRQALTGVALDELEDEAEK